MEKAYIRIKDLPEEDRPRERMQRLGVSALSDAELIALLLRTGTKDSSAITLAYRVLDLAANNLYELGKLSLRKFQRVPGVGEAKAVAIAAALELGRRRQHTGAVNKPIVGNSHAAADVLIPILGDLDYEAFCVLYLNQGNRVLEHKLISTGGITGTVADMRMILEQALLCHATQMIVAHNHPSGNVAPSRSDKRLTEKLHAAAALMDIILLDHLIIAGGGDYFSMNDAGLILQNRAAS